MFEDKEKHMETISQYQYSEVYISDMVALKKIFIQRTGTQKITAGFGIPFLLIKKKNEILAFASLIINEKGGIGFTIYENRNLTSSEKKNFALRAEVYSKKNSTPNFRNPEQLKSSIQRMIEWLND
ncbi:hypothetical protein IW15_02625 [Chryseobacterium soli]|uniref:Uncharacterized protein n=2 Tax=Chryseobacterium soli TaxID=445961 RepID=A0A086ACD8_9FLAO|nr:hypothetical protein IW15_02625 [Chryseobacterium soli]